MTRIILISALFWILSLLVYRLILKKYTFHRLNRWYLLATLLGGVLLPFMPITPSSDAPFTVLLAPITIQLEGVAAGVMTPVAGQSIDYTLFLWLLYGGVSIYLIVQILKNIRQICRKAKQGEMTMHKDVAVIYSPEVQQPFSFWKWIFLNDNQPVSDIVLAHEYAHIKERHSWDKILVQLLQAIYWMIPIFGFYRRYINEVQEYIADEYVLHATSKKKYSYFLLRQTHIAITPVLSNNFHSLIKNRIKMILKEKSKAYKQLWYLPIMVLMVTLASVILVSCNADEGIQESLSMAQEKMKTEALKPASHTVEVIDTIITFNPETYEETIDIVKSKLEVFKKVDEMPLFTTEGCEGSQEEIKMCSDKKMLQFIYQNINYPSEAREKGIEGTEVIKFVIDSDGYMVKTEIMKSLSPGIDQEVLQVLSKMQEHRWIPGKEKGKKVAVEFILPIKFLLR